MLRRNSILVMCCLLGSCAADSSSQVIKSGAPISGTVHGLNGAPGIAAGVSLFSTDQVFQTKADASGSFVFSDVPTGIYQLQALAPGFRRKIVSNVAVTERPAPSLEVVLEFTQCDAPFVPSLPDLHAHSRRNTKTCRECPDAWSQQTYLWRQGRHPRPHGERVGIHKNRSGWRI